MITFEYEVERFRLTDPVEEALVPLSVVLALEALPNWGMTDTVTVVPVGMLDAATDTATGLVVELGSRMSAEVGRMRRAPLFRYGRNARLGTFAGKRRKAGHMCIGSVGRGVRQCPNLI
jgi:hypothetical protein